MSTVRCRHALKEWAVVVQALLDGRQVVLLRKGGIHEPHGELGSPHEDFFFYPAREHQRLELLKPEARGRYATAFEPVVKPEAPELNAFATLKAAVALGDARKAYDLSDEHIWTEDYVRQRVEYKPDRPLFVLILRVHRLVRNVMVPWNERYAGCRSWVELVEPVEAELGMPALDDEAFEAAVDRVRKLLDG